MGIFAAAQVLMVVACGRSHAGTDCPRGATDRRCAPDAGAQLDSGTDVPAPDAGSPPEDLCGVDNGGCDPRATCEDGTGEVVCTCPDPLVGDGVSCRRALDDLDGRLKAPNPGDGDIFGRAVAMSGNGTWLATGAPYEGGGSPGVGAPDDETSPGSGAVYLYRFAPDDGWSFVVKIKAPDPGPPGPFEPPRHGDWFGRAVALDDDGDTLVIGALGEDGSASGVDGPVDDDLPNAGAAYLYRRDATDAWVLEAYIKSPTPGADDGFGGTVALSAAGDRVAVGATGEDGGSGGVDPPVDDTRPQSGAAYLYARGGDGTWSLEATFKAPEPRPGDGFGSVSLSGDGQTLAVGAFAESSASLDPDTGTPTGTLTFSGAAYVFRRSEGSWAFEAALKASDPGAEDRLGRSLALDGDGRRLIVATPNEDVRAFGVNPETDGVLEDSGAAWVFERGDDGWREEAYLKAPNGVRYLFFGEAVAMSADGTAVAVGASGEDGGGSGIGPVREDDSRPDSGAVYVYRRDGTVWFLDAFVKAVETRPSPAFDPGDRFGSAVALSADGRVLAVGAIGEDGVDTATGGRVPSADDSGAVYVYR